MKSFTLPPNNKVIYQTSLLLSYHETHELLLRQSCLIQIFKAIDKPYFSCKMRQTAKLHQVIQVTSSCHCGRKSLSPVCIEVEHGTSTELVPQLTAVIGGFKLSLSGVLSFHYAKSAFIFCLS